MTDVIGDILERVLSEEELKFIKENPFNSNVKIQILLQAKILENLQWLRQGD